MLGVVLCRATSWNSVILLVFSKSGYSMILCLPVHPAVPPGPMVLLMWSLTKWSLAQSDSSREGLPFSRPFPGFLGQVEVDSVSWSDSVWSGAPNFFFPRAGFLISLCWKPKGYCQPISPACCSPFEWKYTHLLYQLLLSICISQLAEATVWLILHMIHAEIRQDWPQYPPLGYTSD